METIFFIFIYFAFPILLTLDHHIKILPNSKIVIPFSVWKGFYYCGSAIFMLIYHLSGFELMNNTITGFAITIAIFEGLPLLLIPKKSKEHQNKK